MTDTDALARAYAKAFLRLDEESLPELVALVADDVRFVDPFNDVRGSKRFFAIFERAIADMEDLSFVTSRIAVEGDVAFLRWTMSGRPRTRWLGERLAIEGVTEVTFGPDGRVVRHVDHWDAASQLYERLPLLGSLLRKLRRKLALEG